MVSILEVLIHAPAFWARAKQSDILAKMVISMQAAQTNTSALLKRKAAAILDAVQREKHS